MPKPSLIISSDKLDKLFPTVNLTSISAAMNWEAEPFVTFWGLFALKKGFKPESVSSDYAKFKKPLLESIRSGSLPN